MIDGSPNIPQYRTSVYARSSGVFFGDLKGVLERIYIENERVKVLGGY